MWDMAHVKAAGGGGTEAKICKPSTPVAARTTSDAYRSRIDGFCLFNTPQRFPMSLAKTLDWHRKTI